MAKMSLERRLEKYEDFYERAFRNIDIDEIYLEGASASEEKFKEITKGKIVNDYHKVMFNRPAVKKKDALGKEIFERFFRKEEVTLNKAQRVIVRTSYKISFKGKTYKGGQYLPKGYFARRTN